MSRGFEPFHDMLQRRQGPQVVNLLQKKQYPPLDTSAVDQIIYDCWHNSFPHIFDLANRIRDSLDPPLSERVKLTDTHLQNLIETCRGFVEKEFGSREPPLYSSEVQLLAGTYHLFACLCEE